MLRVKEIRLLFGISCARIACKVLLFMRGFLSMTVNAVYCALERDRGYEK